jgi:hypothetical protein
MLAHISYPGADREIRRSIGTNSGDGSRTFATEDVREAGRVVDA